MDIRWKKAQKFSLFLTFRGTRRGFQVAKLANQSYGSLLLGIVSAGLIAFAVYSLSDARYRRI